MGDWEKRAETVRLWRALSKTRDALTSVLEELEHATFDHECLEDNCERCGAVSAARSALQWPGGKGVENAVVE